MQLTEAVLDPFVSERDQTIVNATDADHIQVVLLLDGTVRIDIGGVTDDCHAPDVFVRDYAYPSVAQTSDRIHCAVVYIAHSFLETAIGRSEFQGRLEQTPDLMIFRQTVSAMLANLPVAAASSAVFYASTLRDLTAALLIQAGPRSRDTNGLQLLAAKRYIAACPVGALSPHDMSVALGMSRSVLYRLFERNGGVLAYDRMRRLRALYRAVCDCTDPSPLIELARRHGFNDRAALSRSFRKAFGCSPGELRTRTLSANRLSQTNAASAIREAIESLS